MLIIKRQGVILASKFARGAAVVAGVWLLLGSVVASPLSEQPRAAAAAPSFVQQPACPLQPAAPVAGRKDGQFVLQSDLPDVTAGNIASFIVLGKEAAAAGRPRDAEVAFLMSCRVAEKLKGADSADLADAQYQLGRLYASLALEEGPGARARRAELRKRAERLYEASLRTYQAKYSPAHEKTRFAAEGLAALKQSPRSAPEGASPPSQASAASLPPRPETAMALPAQHESGAVASPGPSFDCAKARSMAEKMICSDAELARLDRELGRVYARAKTVAADGAAFKRQNSEEWRRREATCHDRECLLRWYASRHDQLINGLQGQESAPSTPVR